MNKEFVPYEIALELKELGFDERCFAVYFNPTQQLYFDKYINEFTKDVRTLAPTFSQAFRWFREEYCIPSYIRPNLIIDTPISYQFCIEDNTIDFWFKTYEEAELECLKKLIKLV